MPAKAEDKNNMKCPDHGILSSSEDAGQLPTNFWQRTMRQSFCMTDVICCNVYVHMQRTCVFLALISCVTMVLITGEVHCFRSVWHGSKTVSATNASK